MTVASTNIVDGPYTGNGITTAFAYTFRVENKNQLIVYETDDATPGVITTLTVDTDYTVASIGVDAGGLVTRVAGALPANYTWYIRSNYLYTQDTDFDSQGSFSPSVHEAALDKLTFLVQQMQDELGRAVKLPNSYSGSFDPELPAPEDGKYMQWNGSEIIMVDGTVSVSAAEVRTLTDAATDSNVFTDADHTKLDTIETSAKDDQTLAELLVTGNTSGGTNLDMTGDGITFDSGTNLLDDYEEAGTFTAEFSDGTNEGTQSVSVGKYQKVGNRVNIEIQIAVTTIDSMSGALRIKTLPFACADINGGITSTYGFSLAMAQPGSHVSGLSVAAATYMNLHVWDTGASGVNPFTAAKLTDGGVLYFIGSYTTNS